MITKFKQFKIDSICKEYGIENYTINSDGSIDVNGDVDLSIRNLKKLPLTFRHVSGNFNCYNNKLITLEGSPQKVEGNFYCSRNKLTSLEGSPQKVEGYFSCNNNQLTSLEGSPQKVEGNFSCDNNQLTSLEGGPQKVEGNFYCRNNQLKDVKGFPERFYGKEIFIFNNPVEEIFDLFPEDKWVELPESLNEYDVPRDGKLIILQRLEQCFYDLGLEIPENLEKIKFKNYEIREF